MIRTERTVDVINEIVDRLSDKGISIDFDSRKEAVNFRQRVYNYRNAVNKDNSNPELIKKLKIVNVAVDENTVHLTLGMPDYIEKINLK